MYARVKINKKTTWNIGLMLWTAAMLWGCSSEQVEAIKPVIPQEPEPISLAFSSVSSSRASTRLDASILQTNGEYRTINEFHFVALKKDNEGKITSASNAEVDHQQVKDHLPTRYYHFNYCDMPYGVNGCLVYAKALDVGKGSVIETSAFNGKLNPVIPVNLNSVNQIYFDPISIYSEVDEGEDGVDPDDRIHANARKLADALNAIANVSVDDNYWINYTGVPELKQLSSKFTNDGNVLPGSAASVRKWIEALITAADGFRFGDGTIEQKLRQGLVAKASEYLNPENVNNILGLTYPRDINLPDGAAVLRWMEVEEEVDGVTKKVKKFVPQLRTTTLDNINSITDFVYPPALFYQVNSTIKTSDTSIPFDGESGYQNDAYWSTVLARFSGTAITATTKTVAVVDPLQYAVARLHLKVKANSSSLPYDEEHNITINNGSTTDYFRLTGVIVGGQRRVDYSFKPIDNSTESMRFVYDTQIANNCYLINTDFKELQTLVLQSWDDEDLNIILEFEYTGPTDFKCLTGTVYPDTRFYLVGEVKAADYKEGTGDATSRGRVFTQDYTTTIEATVQSLENAYNVLPSILAKNLEIGVMTTPEWKAATPSDPVVLE